MVIKNKKTTFMTICLLYTSYSEIAEELNISVKAVEKRIHLALLELRKIYQKI